MAVLTRKYVVYTYVCMCTCVHVCADVPVCGGEKTTSDVIPQVTPTVFGVTGFFTGAWGWPSRLACVASEFKT